MNSLAHFFKGERFNEEGLDGLLSSSTNIICISTYIQCSLSGENLLFHEFHVQLVFIVVPFAVLVLWK